MKWQVNPMYFYFFINQRCASNVRADGCCFSHWLAATENCVGRNRGRDYTIHRHSFKTEGASETFFESEMIFVLILVLVQIVFRQERKIEKLNSYKTKYPQTRLSVAKADR